MREPIDKLTRKGSDPLEIGRTYRVELDDCCVEGEFTSQLTRIIYESEDDDYPEIEFANGVKLTTFWGAKFQAVEERK
jgi:hypothetical protein